MKTTPHVHRLSWLASALLSSVLLAAPAPARAQGTPKAALADQVEAKRHFDVGLKLYKEQVYEPALLEFQASYRLGGRPTALRNMAQCYRELKQFAAAHGAFDKLLNEHAAQLKEKERADIRRALAELTQMTGTLRVSGNEPGATILVAGRPVATTPTARPIRIDVGMHRVRVTKEGFDPVEREVTLSGQQELPFEFALQREVTTGHLAVRERGSKAVHVIVDGTDVGAAPWEGELAPGPHTIELRGQNLGAPKQSVDVAKKERRELVVDAAPTVGKARVSALPAAATIRVDGKPVGRGLWEGELDVGKHQLEVVAEGYFPYSREVMVDEGARVLQDVALVAVDRANAKADKDRIDKEAYRGLYGNFSLLGAFSLNGYPTIPAPAGAASAPTKPVGGGVDVRVGYLFDWVGVELAAAFVGDYRTTTQTYATPSSGVPAVIDATVPRTEELRVITLDGFVGAGARAMSKDSAVRFTAGLAPGVAFHTFLFNRSTSGSFRDSSNQRASATAFAMLFDAGVLFGSTPGLKFKIAAVGWLAFPSSVATDAETRTVLVTSSNPNVTSQLESPSYPLAKGPQFFLGPSLGMQFGH